jgi:hypothetical protein
MAQGRGPEPRGSEDRDAPNAVTQRPAVLPAALARRQIQLSATRTTAQPRAPDPEPARPLGTIAFICVHLRLNLACFPPSQPPYSSPAAAAACDSALSIDSGATGPSYV